MSNLDSVFNTFQSGANAYSNKFTDHSYNVANAGSIAAKKRDSYLSTINSVATPTTFSPAGVFYKPTIDIETIGGVKPTPYTTNFMVKTKALVVVNEVASDLTPGQYGFTKVGSFYPDKNGDLQNHVGKYLKVVLTDNQGNPIKPNVSAFDQLSTLNVKDRIGLPKETTYLNLFAGLPSAANVGDPAQTQPKLVYDAKGNQYNVVMSYTKINSFVADPANSERWRITTTADTATVPPVAATINAAWAPGNGVDIVFSNGVPVIINEGNPMPALTITPPAGTAVAPINIAVNPGTLNKSDGLTVLGGTKFNNRDIEADGKGAGKYKGLVWDANGFGIISYDNGEQEIVCRIPLVTFKSMNSLIEGSDGVYYSSDESGPYSMRFPANGEIVPSAVEESTASATDTYVAMARDGKRFSACLSGLGKTIDMLNHLEKLLERA